MTDETRRAWAYLSRVAESPCPELATLVEQVGPLEAAGRVKAGDIDPEVLCRVEARREFDCAADDLAVLDRMGGRLITPDDDEWPLLRFRAFRGDEVTKRRNGHPPLVLWAVGPVRLDEATERAAAIVGTRAATAYGEHVAAELSAGLIERNVTVVSGGAYGIDGAAHRAALACEGVTIAIVAGGIDNPYPAGHSALFHRIRQECLLVSEYPPGTAPGRLRFLTRNRLVAGLSRGDGGGGGGAAQRCGQYRVVGPSAGPLGVRGAGSGDLGRIGRLPRAAAGPRSPGGPGRADRRNRRSDRRTGAGRATSVRAARRTHAGRETGVRRAACARCAHGGRHRDARRPRHAPGAGALDDARVGRARRKRRRVLADRAAASADACINDAYVDHDGLAPISCSGCRPGVNLPSSSELTDPGVPELRRPYAGHGEGAT